MRGSPESISLLGRKDSYNLLRPALFMIPASGGGLAMCTMYTLYDEEEDGCGLDVAVAKRHNKTAAATIKQNAFAISSM